VPHGPEEKMQVLNALQFFSSLQLFVGLTTD